MVMSKETCSDEANKYPRFTVQFSPAIHHLASECALNYHYIFKGNTDIMEFDVLLNEICNPDIPTCT